MPSCLKENIIIKEKEYLFLLLLGFRARYFMDFGLFSVGPVAPLFTLGFNLIIGLDVVSSSESTLS